MVVGNLPVGFASTHEQRKPGRTQGHDRKPQLEAQQSEVQRPGEDRGRSLHPWGLTGCRYASERGEPTGRSATPSPRTHRPAYHSINDTREASQLSDPSPRRGALLQAQRRPEAERNALGLLFGVRASAEGVFRAWATRAQQEGGQARVVPA